jgi:hypothetical protein
LGEVFQVTEPATNPSKTSGRLALVPWCLAPLVRATIPRPCRRRSLGEVFQVTEPATNPSKTSGRLALVPWCLGPLVRATIPRPCRGELERVTVGQPCRRRSLGEVFQVTEPATNPSKTSGRLALVPWVERPSRGRAGADPAAGSSNGSQSRGSAGASPREGLPPDHRASDEPEQNIRPACPGALVPCPPGSPDHPEALPAPILGGGLPGNRASDQPEQDPRPARPGALVPWPPGSSDHPAAGAFPGKQLILPAPVPGKGFHLVTEPATNPSKTSGRLALVPWVERPSRSPAGADSAAARSNGSQSRGPAGPSPREGLPPGHRASDQPEQDTRPARPGALVPCPPGSRDHPEALPAPVPGKGFHLVTEPATNPSKTPGRLALVPWSPGSSDHPEQDIPPARLGALG